MTHFTAAIRKTTSKTRHSKVTGLVDRTTFASFPQHVRAEIVAEGPAYLLLRFDESNQCVGDTWHETVEAAKAQAKFEFLIEDEEWELTN